VKTVADVKKRSLPVGLHNDGRKQLSSLMPYTCRWPTRLAWAVSSLSHKGVRLTSRYGSFSLSVSQRAVFCKVNWPSCEIATRHLLGLHVLLRGVTAAGTRYKLLVRYVGYSCSYRNVRTSNANGYHTYVHP